MSRKMRVPSAAAAAAETVEEKNKHIEEMCNYAFI